MQRYLLVRSDNLIFLIELHLFEYLLNFLYISAYMNLSVFKQKKCMNQLKCYNDSIDNFLQTDEIQISLNEDEIQCKK